MRFKKFKRKSFKRGGFRKSRRVKSYKASRGGIRL